jgi:hypothetical protein
MVSFAECFFPLSGVKVAFLGEGEGGEVALPVTREANYYSKDGKGAESHVR